MTTTGKIRTGALAAILTLGAATAAAEGYQVNTLSSRQLGMAHTGIAMKLGAESQFFNPAGMAFMGSNGEASASFNAVMPTATAIVDGKEYKTDCDPSTPFSAFASFKIYDFLTAGVSVYTPYGSGINWTDNWPGATLNQSVNLKAFTVQPTVAWKILPGLSVGAGLTINWGNVDLSKGLLSGAEFNAMLSAMGGAYPTPEITPASAHLTGNAGIACGFNIGAMYDVTSSITVGVNYRSKTMLKVKAGKTDVIYGVGNPTLQGILSQSLDGISHTDFSAEMPMPASLGFGLSWHNDRVTADLETQLTFWSAYKQLDITFQGLPQFDQHLEKNYHDAWLVRAGVEWKATKRLDLRAGLMLDLSPVDKQYYNPETPGMTKLSPTLGLTFRPLSWLGINVAGMYVAGLGEDGASYTSTNILGQKVPFKADYRVHSWVGSLGVSLAF